MSKSWKASVARRPLLAALGGLAGIGIVGSAVYEVSGLMGTRAAHGPYGDLLANLGDKSDATVVGKAVLAGESFQPAKVAERLRRTLRDRTLSDVLVAEAVQNRVVETQGWVLPETLTGLCALTAVAP
jgi:hypothetical protein